MIDNAIKFNKPQGTIEISVNKKENNIQVEINDTGIGIEKEKLNHIYDKFYTTSEKDGKSGNGLGLAITKKILDLHNAKIIVKSIKNKGTKFIITLKQSGM